MTKLAQRILMTLVVLPAVLLLCTIVGVGAATSNYGGVDSIWLILLVLCAGIPGGWLILWSRAVIWRAYRIILTGLLFAVLLAGSFGAWMISNSAPGGGWGWFVYLGVIVTLVGPLLCLTPTLLAIFWRPTKSELAAPMARATQTASSPRAIQAMTSRSFRMTRTVSRLLLSIGLLPLGILAFALLMFLGLAGSGDSSPILASLGTLVLAMVYWFLVWMRGVRWTANRAAGTFIAAVVAVGMGVIVGAICGIAAPSYTNGFNWSVSVAFGSLAIGVTWLIATPMAWCETKTERKERQQREARDFGGAIHCVHCGYHMAGLTQARCPECGTEYTLEALLAANVDRANPDRVLES